MTRPVTDEEFGTLLRSFGHSAFRLETRPFYAMSYERAGFEGFLAGNPVPPPELDWWRVWLDQVARLTAEGKTVARVRVTEEPPSDYQRWLLWATPWYAAAGEDIRCIPRGRAQQIGLPLDRDWWLLDGERLILMEFTADGELAGKSLITDPGTISTYRAWRDLAVRHATAAARTAAA
jgi:hypothetical protein